MWDKRLRSVPVEHHNLGHIGGPQPADHRRNVTHQVLLRFLTQRIARLARLRKLVNAARPLKVGHDVNAEWICRQPRNQAGEHEQPAAKI